MTFDIKTIDDKIKHYSFNVLKNSFTEGKGNFHGAIGEAAAIYGFEYFGFNIRPCEDFHNCDFLANDKKIEVKTAKYMKPSSEIIFHKVNEKSLHQRPDFYVFVHYYDFIGAVKICGVISRVDFYKHSTFLPPGALPFAHSPCYFVLDEHLTPINKLKAWAY